MANFGFLLKRREFASFSGVAVSSERLLHIDTSAAGRWSLLSNGSTLRIKSLYRVAVKKREILKIVGGRYTAYTWNHNKEKSAK